MKNEERNLSVEDEIELNDFLRFLNVVEKYGFEIKRVEVDIDCNGHVVYRLKSNHEEFDFVRFLYFEHVIQYLEMIGEMQKKVKGVK